MEKKVTKQISEGATRMEGGNLNQVYLVKWKRPKCVEVGWKSKWQSIGKALSKLRAERELGTSNLKCKCRLAVRALGLGIVEQSQGIGLKGANLGTKVCTHSGVFKYKYIRTCII